MFKKLSAYTRLTRMNKPVGWLLLLWPTLWAVWIAGYGSPKITIVVIFVVGVIIMRAAGCIVNDYLDKDLDGHVSRTRNRPLVTGEVTTYEALLLFVVLIVMALFLVLILGRLTLLFALVGFFLVITYPLFKRFTHLPQLYLGVVFSWGIPLAFVAQQGKVPNIAWMLFLANFLWVVAYDTMYAMADRPDDKKIGIKSTAILVGKYDLIFNIACQAASLGVLAAIGNLLELGLWFYAGLCVAGLTAVYQSYLCKSRDRELCLKAFINNIWFGGAIFIGLVMA
ncbi:MAG: 4-hydroxybenzoate octaprenyltransferase [Acidiferrobacteraceae bacterium]|nr:4-hydroxybenzoate octaprenyltransferase [Acidiferrobacteraceae bacterium]|tara:strand:- start:1658 stop:2503 length:846 start_codon:yes stop_codon:yes gene_type:complete